MHHRHGPDGGRYESFDASAEAWEAKGDRAPAFEDCPAASEGDLHRQASRGDCADNGVAELDSNE